jgi:hypothetical protein
MADDPDKKVALYFIAGTMVFAMTVMLVMATANTPLFAEKPIPLKIEIPATPGK